MYKVVWSSNSQQNLWTVWRTSSDDLNLSVVSSMRQAHEILSANPQQAGESRDRGRRVLMIEPATFVYRVLEEEQLVRVLSVRVWQQS